MLVGGPISESCAGVLVESAVLEFVELTTVAVEGLQHEQVVETEYREMLFRLETERSA